MIQKQAPLLVGLVATALLLRWPASPSTTPPAAGSAATSFPAGAATAGGDTAAAPGALAAQPAAEFAWREYTRLYREVLDVQPPPPATGGDTTQIRGRLVAQPVSLDVSVQPRQAPVSAADLSRIAESAKKQGYHMEFMIALVADPIDSRLALDFDLALSALQRGLADGEYRPVCKWLPWTDLDAGEQKQHRGAAGMMLFRYDQSQPGKPEDRSLLAVFVVGETPKLGIHKLAFQRAVEFILTLQPQVAGKAFEIPVVGPTFSGSVDSLRLAIAAVPPDACFRIVSGSAAAPGLEARLQGGPLAARVRFSRTLVDEDTQGSTALAFLRDKMGWDLDRAALLIEYDTVYGGELLKDRIPGFPQILRLSFPSGLFALRNAWEEAGYSPPAQDVAANPKALPRSRTTLDVSLKDQGTPIDVVPELSPLTPRIGDMAAANLLREISRSRISYIGILATDIKDELFLAEQIRRWAPGVILFVFDNNLLYIHPQYNATMFGTLAISSFPLAPEGSLPVLSLATPANYRRQFASALQEGTFLAVGSLLGKPTQPADVWIAACGNFTMTPLARLPVNTPPPPPHWKPSLGPHLRASPAPPAARPSARATLQPLLLLLALAGASYALRRAAFFPWASSTLRPRASGIQTLLLRVGSALLSFGAAGVLGLEWPPERTVRAWLLFAPQVFGYLVLAGLFVQTRGPSDMTKNLSWSERLDRKWHRWVGFAVGPALPVQTRGPSDMTESLSWSERLDRKWHRRVGLAVGLALPPLLGWLAFRLWQVDGDGFFRLRARAFSSGLSPLVSLAWLLAAVVFWIFIELKRRLVRERHRTSWPFHAACDRRLSCARPAALKIDRVLDGMLPPGRWWRLAPLFVMVLPVLAAGARMQPISEHRSYGLIFLVLWAAASVLGLESFARFLGAWHYLKRILRSVEQAELVEVLKPIGSKVGWKPMAFNWYAPSYTALKQEVKQLERQVSGRAVEKVVTLPPSDLCVEIERVADDRRRFAKEVALQRDLESRFRHAERRLATEHHSPGVDDFYAARLIAYLRQIFNQLRYFVVGAFGTGLAAVVAVVTFAFEPRQLLMLSLATIVLGVSAATATVFVQMERNVTLSAIGGTEAGKVSLDWLFVSKILTYVLLPALTLTAGQFPSIGRLLSGMLDPLARLLGAG
jgi:hypothetical protein